MKNILCYGAGGVYGAGIFWFGLVYHSQWINSNGWLLWFLYGDIVASIKATMWPIIEGIKFLG
jgi:hypothetical protein